MGSAGHRRGTFPPAAEVVFRVENVQTSEGGSLPVKFPNKSSSPRILKSSNPVDLARPPAYLTTMTRRHIYGCVATLLVCATGLMQGAGSDVADAVMKGDAPAVRRLLTAKVDVNAPQVDGATALHWAVYRDDLETATLLLKAGANVKAVNREGTTPLMMAALYGNTGMIEALLKAGADAKELGPYGETTVMLAARNGKPEAIKMLVAAGADVNAAESIRGTTALMWAAEEGHAAAVKALVELGANIGAKSGPAGLPRNYMAQAVNVNAVQAAAKRRREARLAGRTMEEQTAFEQANGLPSPSGTGSGGGNLAVAGAAPAAGGGGGGGAAAAAARRAAAAADADAQQDVIIAGLVGGGSGGLTPLVFAAREGDLETAKVLLDAGADINQTTEYGWTPLLVATNNRNYKLAAMLLERGANPNIANKGGWTPSVSRDRQPQHRRRRLSRCRSRTWIISSSSRCC